MAEEGAFQDLIRRVRAGDEQAAAELVRRYEPAIRRVVRIRLRDPRLRRLLDTMDICQSVLLNFFVRAAAGQFELESPEQLLKLLATMARHSLTNQALKQQAACRDHRRLEAAGTEGREPVSSAPSPSRYVSARELLEEAHRRLPARERQLQDLREQGREWAEIADLVGGSPEALRKQLARAVDRVAAELGLEEIGHA
jgi:RNA polymerase sigma-70 factor (ECF subfamily)